MKSLYSLFVLAILSLVSLEAKAFTLNVEIDDPARISEVTTYPAQSKSVDHSSGHCEVYFSDTNQMRYVVITPATGKYITSYELLDNEGNVLDSKAINKSSKQYISINAKADGGTLFVYTADELKNDAKLTVNLDGNPSNVKMFLGNTQQTLTKGTQEILFSEAVVNTVYLMPNGVTKFYKVMVDGEEKAATVAASEGNTSYQYQYSMKIHDGSVIDITVDYPDVYRNCSITAGEGMEDFVQTVTVDGVPVGDWTNFQVKMGSMLAIKANTYDYYVDSFTLNGQERSFTLGEWEYIVEDDDLDIRFAGSFIERPLTATVITYNWNYMGNDSKGFYSYEFFRADRKIVTLEAGENILKFNELESPFDFRVYCENQDEVKVAINGEQLETPFLTGKYDLALKDGDLLQIYLGTGEIPTKIQQAHGNEATAHGKFYNLAGQRVTETFKGIVVKEGKTVLR